MALFGLEMVGAILACRFLAWILGFWFSSRFRAFLHLRAHMASGWFFPPLITPCFALLSHLRALASDKEAVPFPFPFFFHFPFSQGYPVWADGYLAFKRDVWVLLVLLGFLLSGLFLRMVALKWSRGVFQKGLLGMR